MNRADTLRAHLADLGFTDLQSEIPILGKTPDGAEVSGTIDLLAHGPDGCLIVDHKTGGSSDGIGPYWGQLSAYADLVAEHFPTIPVLGGPVLGVAVHWMDHGTLETVQIAQDAKGIPAL
ncbi:MAG: PD-(D/E)XK nuclease family protein [Paracoccaceae bacterium]|uniref:PD-(D/E)XK nuclease family protein n=1 Tax=Paracoccaceae TaxID=31989 RepID=UPI0032992D22